MPALLALAPRPPSAELWEALAEAVGRNVWNRLPAAERDRWRGRAHSWGMGPRRLPRSHHGYGRQLFLAALTWALADFPDQAIYRDWSLSELSRARQWGHQVQSAWQAEHPQWAGTVEGATLWLDWQAESVRAHRQHAYGQVQALVAGAVSQPLSPRALQELRDLQWGARGIYDRYIHLCAICAADTAGGCCRGHWMGRFATLDARAWSAASLALPPLGPSSHRICPFGSEAGCGFPPDLRPVYCAGTPCQHGLHAYSQEERLQLDALRLQMEALAAGASATVYL